MQIEEGEFLNIGDLEIPLTTKISDSGKDILGAINPDSNSFLYEIPVSKKNSVYGSLESEDETLAKGFRTEDGDQIMHSVDESGLTDYETLLNLDNYIEKIEMQRRDLIGGKHAYKEVKEYKYSTTRTPIYEEGVNSRTSLGGIDYNTLDEETRTKYDQLTEQLNKVKNSKKELNQRIFENSQVIGSDIFSNTISTKSENDKYNLVYSSDNQIYNKIDQAQNFNTGQIIAKSKNEQTQELATKFSTNTKSKEFIKNYEVVSRNGKKFSGPEEMMQDPVFMQMYSDFQQKNRNELDATIAVIDKKGGKFYEKATQISATINSQKEKLEELKTKRKNGDIDEDEYTRQAAKLTESISHLTEEFQKNRDNRGFARGTEIYDTKGERIEEAAKTSKEETIMYQQVASREGVLLAALNESENKGEYIKSLYKAQDGLWSTEKLHQDTWENHKFTLPSGEEMTLHDMYTFIWKASGEGEYLVEGLLDFFAVDVGGPEGGQPLAYARSLRERTDLRLQDELGVVSVNQQMRSIDKTLGVWFAKNLGAKLMGADKENAEFMLEMLGNFKNNYYQNQTQLMAISNVLTFNVDPGLEWQDKSGTGLFLRQMMESFGHAVFKREVYTEDDMINYYDDIANAYGIELTQDQKDAGEINLNDMVAQGVGTTLPIMLEMLATMPIAGAGVAKLSKLPGAINLMNKAKKTKVGTYWWKFAEDVVSGSIAFEMTSGDQATWRMGAAEVMAEKGMKGLFKRVPVATALMNIYKKYGQTGVKVATLPPRILAGGGAELIAEYSGEFVENLSAMGFDWNEALAETIGRSKDERINKLVTTAIICVGMSTGFTLMTANTIEQQFTDMLDSGNLPPEDQIIVQNALDAIKEQKNSQFGQHNKQMEDGDLQNALDQTPEDLQWMDELGGDDDDGGGGAPPLGGFGQGPGGMPVSNEERRDYINKKTSEVFGNIINIDGTETFKNAFDNKSEPSYIIGPRGGVGTSVSQQDMMDLLNDPVAVEGIKRGDINLSINNDQGLADLFMEKTNPSMPASGGRQLNLFEDESVRGSAGNKTSNNAGNRLFNDPNPETKDITSNYINNNSSNLGIQHSDATPVTEVNEENSKNISDAYDAMEHNPDNPKVKKSYEALANETVMQYQELINAGYTIEVYKGKGEPYANSDEMIKDVRNNKHLYIFSTEGGFGEGALTDKMRSENPLLQPTEFTDVNGEPLLVNDLFRAIHDFFGHTELGNGFGVKGEENAWLNHSRMFGHDARRAMTTETRGQNSWVNFNRENIRREDGSIPKKGDPDYVKPQDRKFADQKVGLLPDEFVFQQPVTEDVTTDVAPQREITIDGKRVVLQKKPLEGSPDFLYKYKKDWDTTKEKIKEDGELFFDEQIHKEDGTSSVILHKDGVVIGHLLFDADNVIQDIEIGKPFRGNKLSPILYQKAQEFVEKTEKGGVLLSGKSISTEAELSWKSLVKNGLAEQIQSNPPRYQMLTDREIKTKDLQDVPFRYNRSEKVYKGKVGGREFTLFKKPGKNEWIDPASGTVLGRTKKEAISNLKLAMEGPAATNLLESSDQITENLASVINLINAATNIHDTNVDSDIKSPEDSESLVDRTIRGIDGELDRINRNKGKNLYMDITMGLGPVAWETFLQTLKAGLKAGQSISNAFNKAIDAIKSDRVVDGSLRAEMMMSGEFTVAEAFNEVGSDKSIEMLKRRFLFSNDGVVKFAEEAIANKITGAKFFEALQEKYPDQYNKLEAKEIYKIAKQRINPKVVRGNYTKPELKAIDKTQEKIDRHTNEMANDPSLSDPIQLLFDGGFVVVKGGRAQIKKLPFNFNGAPIFEGLTEQQKIELASQLLIRDFNVNKSKIDLKEATQWYTKTKQIIQEKFGGNANVFFELLGATSPQAPPSVNVRRSTEVLKAYNEGKFDEALNIYDSKVKDIMARHDRGEFGKGKKAEIEAKDLIKKVSSDPLVLAGIKKKNGKTFGLPIVNSGIVRVLYGNWLSNNPANKTGQFFRNLSLRDRNSTIDVWAARNMRRVVYSQGGKIPFRRRSYQESTVSAKDFAFAQSVHSLAARELNMHPDEVQAAMWFIEKQIYDDAGWNGADKTGAAKQQSTITNAINAMQATDRVMVGVSSFIGNTKPEHRNRINKAVSRAIQKALDRGATENEIHAIISSTMQGAIRMDQALLNLEGVVNQLNGVGRPYQTEGLYDNEVEDAINLEILVDSGTDVTPLFDEVIRTGINNEQESVFVSKVTTKQDPNARPFRRIEFDEALNLGDAREMANEIFGPNNIGGLTLNLNQQGDVIGMSFQFVPEFEMKANGEGLTMENIKERESNWVEGADKSINDIKEKYGEDILNTVENGYINTKVFTNGEYETTTRQEKSFDTDINTELARRQRAINSGDNAQDISDLRTGDEYSNRSVQRLQILEDFAAKIDQIYNDLGKNAYSDPFMSIPIIRAALKTASIVLRATSSVAKAIDAAIEYVRQAQKDGDKFLPDQEENIRDFFKDFASNQEGLFTSKEAGVTGETEISEEEMAEREDLEDRQMESNESFVKELEYYKNSEIDIEKLTEEALRALDGELEKNHDAAFIGGKDNFFKRLIDWKFWDDAWVTLKELTVDSKYRIKRSIRNIGKDLNLNEAASNALAAMTLWLTVPGTAKELIDQANKRIWGALSSDQIKKVGKLSTMERIIELDNMSDAKKSAADNIIKELNLLIKDYNATTNKEQRAEIEEKIKQGKKELEKTFENISNINISGGKIRGKKYDGKRWGKASTDFSLEYETKNKDGKKIKIKIEPGIEPQVDPETGNKTFPWRMKHPAVPGLKIMINKEVAEKLIEQYKKDWGKDWDVVRETTDKLFEEYANQLKLNYENGLISEEIYNELRNVKYNPRKFVDHVIFSERNINNLRNAGQNVKADHLESAMKQLKSGSDQVLFMDPVKLLQNTIAVSAKLRFENDVRKSIFKVIQEAASKGFEYINGQSLNVEENLGYILKDGEVVKDGYIEMSYNEGGKKVRFALTQAAYDSLFANPRDMLSSNDAFKKFMTPFKYAGSTLKVFATGVGAPFFFVANVFYDFAQQVLFTETYNGLPWYLNNIAVKFGMAAVDWVSVMGDVARNGELTQEFKRLGGSLEFMTRYGLMDYSQDLAIDERLVNSRTNEILSDPENELNEEQARTQAMREQMTKLYGDDAPYVNPNTKSGWDAFKKAISGLNSISEMTGRLANTRRWTNRYIEEYKKKNDGQEPTGQDLIDIKKRAVAQAVDYANFNNGGTAIKFFDAMGFAYLNAATQVFDKSVRYVSENPVQFAWDMTQWAVSFGAGIMAYNLKYMDILDEDEEDRLQTELEKAIESGDSEREEEIRQKLHNNRKYWIDHISDYDLENYHCIILPGTITDIVSESTETALQEQLASAKKMELGVDRDNRIAEINALLSNNRIVRPRYFKIPSDARMNISRVLVEDLTYKHVTGGDYRTQSKNALSFTPWGRGDEKNSYGRVIQKAIPGGAGNPRDLMSSNPLLNIGMKVGMNYDAFYNRPVWKDYNEAANGYTQYEGRADSYQDKWLKDLSKKSDEWGLIDGGFNVTTTKSALGSLLTNMDRNPINAILNHSYVGVTGGLSDREKEQYGNQMNVFLNDILGPVTKRYVGDIDLLSYKNSTLQQEAKVVAKEEDRFQVNLRLAFNAVMEENQIRKDPNSGQWIKPDGKVLRMIDEDGDGLFDAKELFLSISEDILNQTEEEVKKRIDNDPYVDSQMWNVEERKKRLNRMIIMEWEHGEKSSDVQMAIQHFKEGNPLTSAFMIYEMQKSLKVSESSSLLDMFEKENILGDPEVQYFMKQLAIADDEKLKTGQKP